MKPILLTKAYLSKIKIIFILFTLFSIFYVLYPRGAFPSASYTLESPASIFIPYVYPFETGDTPRVSTTIDGIPFNFRGLPMDTGSTSLAIGAPLLPHINTTGAPTTYHYLSSSKILYNGHLVPLNITFHDRSNNHNATSITPVLLVNSSVTCRWYDVTSGTGICPPNPTDPAETPIIRDTSRITYMGVGFGRNGARDGQPNAIPSANPFLNIRSVNSKHVDPSSWRTGYVISTKGVWLGLTWDNTAGFEFTKLQPGITHASDPRDWAQVPICARVDMGPKHCGSLLVDTGLGQMYWRLSPGIVTPNYTDPSLTTSCKKRPVDGTRLGVEVPGEGNNVFGHEYVVGGADSMEPTYICPEEQADPPFVNTGRNLLFGYDTAFDAVEGRYGFRKVV